jgi:hypothetical protein
MRVNRPARFFLLAAAGALVATATWQGFPLCPMAGSLGIPCPGCGLTRATLALLRGDVRQALHFHPLVWLLAPLFVVFVSAAVRELLRDPARPRRPSRVPWYGVGTNVAATLLLVVTLGVWLARFGGYFGGPAPVTSLYAWLASRR